MFMPPATDDQTRMQQRMMNYMTLFMGVLFFKVPSGLCIYFITSSLWGVAERKLLPKIITSGPGAAKPAPKEGKARKEKKSLLSYFKLASNGQAEKRARRRKQRKG
jgi:YidC/Oxa1 family membrane protein insertase